MKLLDQPRQIADAAADVSDQCCSGHGRPIAGRFEAYTRCVYCARFSWIHPIGHLTVAMKTGASLLSIDQPALFHGLVVQKRLSRARPIYLLRALLMLFR